VEVKLPPFQIIHQNHDFEAEWNAVAQQVMAYCHRAAEFQSDAEEIFQRVAIRAWRGYATFNGEATFLTWVLAIARREISRMMSRKDEQLRIETSLEVVAESTPDMLSTISTPEVLNADYSWISEITRVAASNDVLTQVEAATVLSRLSHPEENWEQIGRKLGIAGPTSAVIHSRAIPKLRVFLFTHRPDLLGGLPVITEAYNKAVADKCSLMSSTEAEVFQRVVLNRQIGYCKAGWRLALRSACSKVIKWLTLP
jgi:RNA polymerase sigma factor (sigma-70 family)